MARFKPLQGLKAGMLVGVLATFSLVAASCGSSSTDSKVETTAEEPKAEVTEPAADVTEPEADVTEPEADSGEAETPADTGPIKIGVLNPTTGNFAVFGEQSNAGVKLYLDSIDSTISGREVELVYADSAGDPQQALEQARRLVEAENVDAIIGLVNSAAAVAIADFAASNEVPLVVAVGSAAEITLPENASTWTNRVSVASGQEEGALGWYAATELGFATADTLVWDFISGVERAAAFDEAFIGAGGEITGEHRPPPNATDYSSFLAGLQPDNTDAMYTFVTGPGSIAFFQQMEEFGITGKIVPLGSGFVTAGILDELGTTALGLIQSSQYTPSIDTPANKTFIESYEAATGQEAGVYGSQGYLAAEAIALAIESLGGDTSDPAAIAAAVRALSFESHAGPISFDENGQVIRDLYITRVIESNGGVVQEIVATVEDVNQGWTQPK